MELGEFYSDHDNIWKALDEARERRFPIAQALVSAFNLPFVKHGEIEIHLKQFDPQIPLFNGQMLVLGADDRPTMVAYTEEQKS